MTHTPITRRRIFGLGALGLGALGLGLVPLAASAHDDDDRRPWPYEAQGRGRGPWYDPRYDARYESYREASDWERRRRQSRRDDDGWDDGRHHRPFQRHGRDDKD